MNLKNRLSYVLCFFAITGGCWTTQTSPIPLKIAQKTSLYCSGYRNGDIGQRWIVTNDDVIHQRSQLHVFVAGYLDPISKKVFLRAAEMLRNGGKVNERKWFDRLQNLGIEGKTYVGPE